jgi:hypothetical protein
MKLVKIVSLAAVAAGSLVAASCCSSAPTPAPTHPTYVSPAK